MRYVVLTDEQFAEWDGTPEDLAAIMDSPALAHAILAEDFPHTAEGRIIAYRQGTECCGAALRTGPDQDSAADEGLCNTCGAELCSACAATWCREDGYGDDGQGVRTEAVCQSCHADREERRQMRDWRRDSGV